MAEVLCELIDAPLAAHETDVPVPNDEDVAEEDRSDIDPRTGELSPLTCPECGGTMWEHYDGEFVRFRCHVGHAYSPASLESQQAEALEAALWQALRTLEERADLFRRMARRSGVSATARRMEARVREIEEHAQILRDTVTAFGREPVDPHEAETAS
jgi:two-component system chemotaxis response regulator CheB